MSNSPLSPTALKNTHMMLHDSKGGSEMSAILATVERYHRLIIVVLVGVILFFLLACTFHDVLPICHYLFGCDHGMHA